MASDNEQTDDNAKANSYARLNAVRAFNNQSEPSFSEEFAAARRKYKAGKGGPTFSFNGKSYTVETREEAARGKANEMARESRRSTAYMEAPKPAERESTSGFGSKITNVPKPGARSIYEGLDPSKVAGAGAAIASAFPAARAVMGAGSAVVRGVKSAVDAVKDSRAGAQVVRDPRTREPMELPAPSKEITRDSDRVNFKNGGKVGCYANGGIVRLGKLKSHGKAC